MAEEEGLAVKIYHQDGYVDKRKYQSLKIIYDASSNAFMSLHEYENLVRNRVKAEI